MPAMALSRVAARVVESGPDGENLAPGAWQRLEALPDPRSPQGRIYPLACLIAIAVCAFTATGNDRFTAVGQWIRRAGQADLARLRAPWDPIGGRYRVPDEKTIRVVLDRLDPRALTRALLGPRPRRRRGGPAQASVRGYRARRASQQARARARGRLRARGGGRQDLEELVDERGRELKRQLLQDHLDLRAAREEEEARERRVPVTGPDGITRTRLETGHGRLLATLFGTVRVTRCAWREPGAGNCCPADAALSLPAARHSHSLAKLAAIEAARGSFEAAHAAVARRCGNVIGKRQLEESVTGAAVDIPAFYAARIPEPCTPSTLVVLSADCKGIVMRPAALRAASAKAAARLGKMRTRLASGEKPNRKRMAALVTVYDAEPAPRRPHDVIAPPGGRHGARALRPGPKALAKWLAGSVREDPADVIAAAFDEAGARDAAHLRTWVVLVDGAEHQLALIRAEAARRGVTIHIIIDIIHVLEYLWGAAWSLHPAGDPAAEDWVAVKALAVLAGDSARAAEEITAEAGSAGLEGSQRTGAGTCVRYLNGKCEFLRYGQALEAGWPIATGVIEGACRHLIADRLGIGGARWGLDGAEAVLTLRAVISNGDFEEYWRFHLERQQQRLYPGIKQGQYTLGA